MDCMKLTVFWLKVLNVEKKPKNIYMCVCVCVFLSRFHEALDLCKLSGSSADWAELGKACLVHMEVELAIQVYRMSGNVGMVLSLQSIQVQLIHIDIQYVSLLLDKRHCFSLF